MTVRVTPHDLATGRRFDPQHCAVAAAIRRQTRLRPCNVGWGWSEVAGDFLTHSPALTARIIAADFGADEPFAVVIDRKALTMTT